MILQFGTPSKLIWLDALLKTLGKKIKVNINNHIFGAAVTCYFIKKHIKIQT
jgi:hypothetical protein